MGKRFIWTNEALMLEAALYQTRSEFKHGSKGAYITAWNRKILDACCAHMPKNIALIWSEEKILAEVLKHQRISHWHDASRSSYAAAKRLGILDKCKALLPSTLRQRKWTSEELKIDALRFETRGQWQINSKAAYSAAYNRGILDECCAHMHFAKLPNNHWNLENCKIDALKYETRTKWNVQSSSSYSAAVRNGWVNECCKHMLSSRRRGVKILCVETCTIYPSILEASKKLGLSTGSIGYVLRGVWPYAKGLSFEYV